MGERSDRAERVTSLWAVSEPGKVPVYFVRAASCDEARAHVDRNHPADHGLHVQWQNPSMVPRGSYIVAAEPIPPGQPAGTVGHPQGARFVSDAAPKIEAGITPGWRGRSLIELAGLDDYYEFDDEERAIAWVERVRKAIDLRVDQEPTIGHVIEWTRQGERSLELFDDPQKTLFTLCDVLLDERRRDPVFAAEVPASWYGREDQAREQDKRDRKQAKARPVPTEPIDLCQFHDPPPPPDPLIDSLTVACPHCGAKAGSACINDGKFKGTHTPRHEQAKREARKATRRAELDAKRDVTDARAIERGRKALRTQLARDGHAERTALGSTPADGEGFVAAHERVNEQIRKQGGANTTRTVRVKAKGRTS